MLVLIFINSVVFLLLAILHFYWAAGGRWGWEASLPRKENGDFLFVPSKSACVAVGIWLLFFVLITLAHFKSFDSPILQRIISVGTWIITAVFFLRAVGDFNYVGFFKKIKSSEFAVNDTKYYSPLCLMLSLVSLMIALKMF